jgi:4-carboxymuconolactone decarboxylase
MNKDAFNKGLATRRAVLGADYVDNSIKNADDFNMPMQELVTEYCWDSIWNRPGLRSQNTQYVESCYVDGTESSA